MNADQITALENAKKIVKNLGLPAEMCGAWLWVKCTEATREHRAELKAAGFRWAPKKERWYFPGTQSRGARGGTEMSSIRTKYGSEDL